LALARQTGEQFVLAWTLAFRGTVAREQGEDAVARASWEQSLKQSHELGFPRVSANCLAGLAGLAVERGQPAPAARVVGAAAPRREAMGAAFLAAEGAHFAAAGPAAGAALGEEAFASAGAGGGDQPLDEAIAGALRPAEPGDEPTAAAPPPAEVDGGA